MVVEGQNYRRPLNAKQTAEMITRAREDPGKCIQYITTEGRMVTGLTQQNPTPLVFSTKLGLIKLDARQIPLPAVRFGQTFLGNTPKWNLKSVSKYSKVGARVRWGIFALTTTEKANEAFGNIKAMMNKRGLSSDDPKFEPKLGKMELSELHVSLNNRLHGFRREGYKLVFVLLPDQLPADEYAYIKRIADVDLGIHTVCVNCRKKQGDQYWDNVLLKVNLKLGGVNQTISHPKPLPISFKTTMVVGLDVTHPLSVSGSNEGTAVMSTVGMVASTDEFLGQWPATIATQTRDKEEVMFNIDTIRALLKPHLARWAKINNAYPQQILVYRDGVSEGQYKQVVDSECKHIKAVCGELYNPAPRVTIVIAAKRHHMRFYREDAMPKFPHQHPVNRGNPHPGTVVDRGVTSQFLWEFYLQAHNAIEGTARPAHYVVVVDEIFANIQSSQMGIGKNLAEVLHDITLGLSFNVGRSTTSTSICTPAYLADKVCDRARCYGAATAVHQKLRDSMFYI